MHKSYKGHNNRKHKSYNIDIIIGMIIGTIISTIIGIITGILS